MLSTILCVDDDPITLMLCKKVIEKVNFAENTATALNGEEAINFFDRLIEEQQNPSNTNSHPALVFLDLNMPVMNGWEFLDIYYQKNYHEIFGSTKIIIISSTIDPKDISESKKYSIVMDFYSKPITKEMLEKLKAEIIA